jgi:splicing factor 3B subunit 2
MEINDNNFAQFSNVFDNFQMRSQRRTYQNEPNEILNVEFTARKEEQESDYDDDEDYEDKVRSKKKLRKLNRVSVATLKQVVKRPDTVDWVDVTATDPFLLVAIKATRNTVSVPLHWSQKRKFLQGKRGAEKIPYELPDYIKDTGIMQLREATATGNRNKYQAKMGRLDIDYSKLHDAFFKFQTKPHFSIHGEIYYEGKEFEQKMKSRTPGKLSDDLTIALNIPNLCPPPWLIAMQRYGPPPR